MSNDQDRERIRSTYGQLDEWRARPGVFRPAAGSELAADDLDWPPLSVTQVASSSLVAALDHLQAFRLHIEGGQLFPFAHPSSLRTALLSAAQAVWVLAPENTQERVKNGRAFALHHDTEHLKFVQDLQRLSDAPHAGTDSVRAGLRERIAALEAMRRADGQKETFSATRVINEVAASTWNGQPAAGLEVQVEWRRGSAAAHGLMWALLGHPENRVSTADGAGMVQVEASGDIAGYLNLYLAVIGLLTRAYHLLDRRSGG